MTTGLFQALLRDVRRFAARGHPLGSEMALALLETPADQLWEVFACAQQAKHHYFDQRPLLCSIINAKSGACPEDCAFCAQSIRHNTRVEVYPLKSPREIVAARDRAARFPIRHFSVVTSGRRLSRRDVEILARMIRSHPSREVAWCASLGALDEDDLALLREAGLKRFHHNLETAPSFFPRICTTHTYEQRVATVRQARRAGLEVCCGGLLGMGETPAQRVELALRLQELEVDSIPLNFLIPLPGTRLENQPPIKPLEALLTIALFRLTNPWTEIRVCAGRSYLRDLQCLIFAAGANGMMIGDLLTVPGGDVRDDLRMLEDLGLLE